MKDQTTPLMRQYNQVKAEHPDCILLFRMGDFFETFGDDASVLSSVTGITLTKRNNGTGGEMPLAGFPHHQIDSYLPKLVKAGYRVAVCEQLEDPKKARGIVKRGVIEVVTPGVAVYDKLLDAKRNNYAAAIYFSSIKGRTFAGLAYADVSTGEFKISEVPLQSLKNVLESVDPSELIVSKSQRNEIDGLLRNCAIKPFVTRLEQWIFDEEFARQALTGHFKTLSLKGFGIEGYTAGITAAGAVLYYIKENRLGQLEQISSPGVFNPDEFMQLDYSTRMNLEIVFSGSDNADGSLLSVLDRTKTPQGARRLKQMLTRPLKNLSAIKERSSAVGYFFSADTLRKNIMSRLSETGDFERLISRICSGRAVPRDLVSLKMSLLGIPLLKDALSSSGTPSVENIKNALIELTELTDMIDYAVSDEPSGMPGSGGIFKSGYNKELDEYIAVKARGKDFLEEYKERERERTGISNLKVGYNNVAGYFIEITNSQKHKAPEDYIRKATLTNAERFITPELKELEDKILGADEKIAELERELFTGLCARTAEFVKEIIVNAEHTAELDCLLSFADVSKSENYTEPEVDDSEVLEISGGRHPVVEKLLPPGDKFTPNSVTLDPAGEMIHVITGPNMSGKSCYLRQTALIVLLAQVGCYVPAEKARIGIVDRIFTRVGARDNITGGESTFLVEMQEAANIMNNAGPKSLLLLDEVGRGTATFDGISIAWSISEYIHDKIKAKTLFATHYHELNELADRYPHIANYRVETIESGETVIFSHKVLPGSSDHSFGIHAAKLAGMPGDIIRRAEEIMKTLESDAPEETDGKKSKSKANTSGIRSRARKTEFEQLSIFEFRDDILRGKILSADLDNMTPIAAFSLLAELFEEAKK